MHRSQGLSKLRQELRRKYISYVASALPLPSPCRAAPALCKGCMVPARTKPLLCSACCEELYVYWTTIVTVRPLELASLTHTHPPAEVRCLMQPLPAATGRTPHRLRSFVNSRSQRERVRSR